ncbi:MAG: hypothetical protein J6R75_04455, partial [Candidatus Methanomethylophilaceae archaeon]|nr:hypothetical protein [Candidatus Methanomethylophilaceae archaeon]
AIVEAVIMQIECKVQSIILAIEKKIAELALYAESQVPGTVATIYVLENAIVELEANLASAISMVGEYPVSEILEEIGLYGVWEGTNYALMELAGNGADVANIALVLINSDCIVNMINSYMMAISTFEMVEFTVSMIVEDFSSYTDDEEYYYDSENYLYISNRGVGVPDLGDSVMIDTIMAQLGSITGGLRLMDYVALLTGNQFDGKVAYDDSVMEHIKLLEGALESSNVIIMDADAGNLMFLLSEILTYEDAEPLDFGIYSGLIGEDATAFLNDIENMLAPYMDIIEENFPEYAMPAEMLTFLAERLAYMALQTMEGLLYMPGVVNLYNELATLMFVGMHNPLENVFIVDGEDVIPVGEIFDAYVTVFNTLVYELCEEMPGVIYIDVTEMYDVEELVIIDTSMLSDPEQMGTIFELIAMFDVDVDYIFEQALAYLDGLECIPTYDVFWTNYDGTLLDYEYNVVDYEGIEYDGDVPVRASDADYDYVFTGEWACEIDGREITYTAIFDGISNKANINGEEGSSDVEFDVTEVGDKDFAKVSVDDFTVVIPAELFAGVETVKVSMKVVEQNDIPGNLLVFTEGKKVISLELFLDGTKTSDFGDNEVTVSVDYALAEGEDASTLAVWYMNEDTMTLEKVKSEYVDGKLVITMDHFSYWVIGHEVVEDDSEDKAFPAMVAVLLVIVVGLCVALLRLKK